VGHGSTNMDGSRHVGHVGHTCDPITHDSLTGDNVNQISRTISITFGIITIKHVSF